MKNVGVKAVDGASLRGSVAAVGVGEDGVTFYTDREAFARLPRPWQFFILGHELGHVVLGSADEELCDAFALGLTAGRQHRSLKSAVQAVASLERVPAKRVEALLALAKRIDKDRKNKTL